MSASLYRKTAAVLALAALTLAATSCSSLQTRQFASSSSRFEPDRYFTGPTHSWGVFETRAGEPSRRFSTTAFGKRDAAGNLILTQDFRFDDGRTQQRVWKVRRVDAHRYEATANDVVGTARGEAHGNAFLWEYTIATNPKNPLSPVRLRQWMYLGEGTQTLFTRAIITKFGVRVAQVTETFRRGR